jgi:Domain of unknown function (DUF1918)
MRAQVGDRIVVHGLKVGDTDRHGVVVEVRGADGGPPFLVDWGDGHQGLYFPAGDAIVEQRAGQPADERQSS